MCNLEKPILYVATEGARAEIWVSLGSDDPLLNGNALHMLWRVEPQRNLIVSVVFAFSL